MAQLFQLHTGRQSIVLASEQGKLPGVVYFGPALAADLPANFFEVTRKPVPPSKLVDYTPVSILPEPGQGYFGQPGLEGHRDGLAWATQFRLVRTDVTAESLALTAEDAAAGLEVKVVVAKAGELFRISSAVLNTGAAPYSLGWLAAAALPVPNLCTEALTLVGRWGREFQEQRQTVPFGQFRIENRHGRTSHEAFPGLILGTPGFGQEHGSVFGFHLGWSGNWRWLVERSMHGEILFQAGELLQPAEILLASGERYETPVLYVGSGQGLNDLSRGFHQVVRDELVRVPHRIKPRLVHFNSWEAVYFDHDQKALSELVSLASQAGAERFVLDDGWFRGRDHDRAALGDWEVDAKKYPAGLQPLIDQVEQAGMEFGLWIEPEMVNEDSDLFRAHPDWILNLPPYRQPVGRFQYVLNLGRPEVFDYLEKSLSRILETYRGIRYLKWDMNRDLTIPGNAFGRPGVHDQTIAVYRLMASVRTRFPEVEIESCASGGGRADFGVLEYACRLWASDNNDAHERVRIQRGMSYFFPPEVIGSHVGPAPSHQTERKLSLSFRAAVALTGHMGTEVDLRDLSSDEMATLQIWFRRYKQHRELLHQGEVRRLETEDPAVYAHVVVSPARDRFLLFVFFLGTAMSSVQGPLRISGLDEKRSYALTLWDNPIVPSPLMRRYDTDLTTPGMVHMAGAFLGRAGVVLPVGYPDTALVVEGVGTSW